jgi:hypothetical protein
MAHDDSPETLDLGTYESIWVIAGIRGYLPIGAEDDLHANAACLLAVARTSSIEDRRFRQNAGHRASSVNLC